MLSGVPSTLSNRFFVVRALAVIPGNRVPDLRLTNIENEYSSTKARRRVLVRNTIAEPVLDGRIHTHLCMVYSITLLLVAAQSELATQIWSRWNLHHGSGDREVAL